MEKADKANAAATAAAAPPARVKKLTKAAAAAAVYKFTKPIEHKAKKLVKKHKTKEEAARLHKLLVVRAKRRERQAKKKVAKKLAVKHTSKREVKAAAAAITDVAKQEEQGVANTQATAVAKAMRKAARKRAVSAAVTKAKRMQQKAAISKLANDVEAKALRQQAQTHKQVAAEAKVTAQEAEAEASRLDKAKAALALKRQQDSTSSDNGNNAVLKYTEISDTFEELSYDEGKAEAQVNKLIAQEEADEHRVKAKKAALQRDQKAQAGAKKQAASAPNNQTAAPNNQTAAPKQAAISTAANSTVKDPAVSSKIKADKKALEAAQAAQKAAKAAKAAAKKKAEMAQKKVAAARLKMIAAQKGLNASIAQHEKLKFQSAKDRATMKRIEVKAARIAEASALLEDAKSVVDTGVKHQASLTAEAKAAAAECKKSNNASRIAHENYERDISRFHLSHTPSGDRHMKPFAISSVLQKLKTMVTKAQSSIDKMASQRAHLKETQQEADAAVTKLASELTNADASEQAALSLQLNLAKLHATTVQQAVLDTSKQHKALEAQFQETKDKLRETQLHALLSSAHAEGLINGEEVKNIAMKGVQARSADEVAKAQHHSLGRTLKAKEDAEHAMARNIATLSEAVDSMKAVMQRNKFTSEEEALMRVR
jgi:hypothetical protein